jgi:putative ABC transport system permease protein
MNKTNIKQATRYIFNQQKFSLVVVIGLSVGMAASFLIYLYVYNERSFDNFHQYGDRLYRVVVTNKKGLKPYKSPYSYAPQGPVAVSEIPEVKNYVRLLASPKIAISTASEKSEMISFTEENYYYADSSFFELFSFPLLYGNPKTVLKEPGSVVISQSTAVKLFGKNNPVGKELKVNGRDTRTITGVFKNIPENTHLRFNVLFSLNTLSRMVERSGWENHSFFTYLLLKKGANPGEIESKITNAFLKENRAVAQAKCEWKLQPVSDAYLKTTDFTSKPESLKFGDNRIAYFLSLIAILILCIAWINYLNLSTAKAAERFKEVEVRRTNGASKIQLIIQFFTESALFNIFSIILAGVIVTLVYPWFTPAMDFSFSFSHCQDFWMTVSIVLATAIMIPGLFSSVFLSSYNSYKNKIVEKNSIPGIILRNGLVIFQFIIIIGLVVGVVVINRQLRYLHSVDLGFQKDQVLVLNAPRIGFNDDKLKTFCEELKKHPGIIDVTASVNIPGERFGSGNGGPAIDGEEAHETYFRVGRVMSNYLDFYGIKLIAGRNFYENQQADNQSIIINAEGVKEFGLQNPDNAILKKAKWNGREYTIIGVTQSFHQQSLHIVPEPMILYTMPFENTYNYVLVKVSTGNLETSISSMKDGYNAIFSGNPFDYFFLDSFFEKQYKKDIAFRKLFNFFSIIALIIGFIGLHGLTTFRIIKRTKEIGVRKVNGARVVEVMAMINKDFIQWIVIAFIISCPISWYAMHKWLENFAYKTELSWWIFAAAGGIAVVIALLTVSGQSFKAATRNPVEALRYE